MNDEELQNVIKRMQQNAISMQRSAERMHEVSERMGNIVDNLCEKYSFNTILPISPSVCKRVLNILINLERYEDVIEFNKSDKFKLRFIREFSKLIE